MTALLIRNLRRHRGAASLEHAAIADGRIVALGPEIDGAAANTIDAQGRVALPGLLEPHIHLDKALLDGRLPSEEGTLEEAIRITGVLKRQQTRADVMARSRAVLDMAVRAGVTVLRAHPDVDPIQGLIGVETALALREEYCDLLDIQVVAFPQEGLARAPGTMDLMEEALRLGADVVGGCPYVEPTEAESLRHVDAVFALAERHGKPLDLHADFADDAADPRFAAAGAIAERAIAAGYQGRVTLGHVTSLAALTTAAAAPVMALLGRAGVSIVSLPATDVFLGGRRDALNRRRGLTPIRALRDAGVNVAFSSNNIRNAFTPFGRVDPLLIGNLLAHVGQFGTPADRDFVLAMCTTNAARAMGIAADYGLAPGCMADLVLLETTAPRDILADVPVRATVIKRGRVTVTTRLDCRIHRHDHATAESCGC